MLERVLDTVSTMERANDSQRLEEVMELRVRRISPNELRRYEGYVAEIFSALGMELGTDATANTPRRFIQAMFDSTSGYDGDPKLATMFQTECRGEPGCGQNQVIEGPIPFFALCEHHALPFFGRAYVGYIAREQIIGISKLTRLVRVFARRFTVQERMGNQIVNSLESLLQPRGVAVYLEAHHLCTQMRGVHESSPLTRTTFFRGEYDGSPALRTEFLTACGLQR